VEAEGRGIERKSGAVCVRILHARKSFGVTTRNASVMLMNSIVLLHENVYPIFYKCISGRLKPLCKLKKRLKMSETKISDN
jgi:hypothetical protein